MFQVITTLCFALNVPTPRAFREFLSVFDVCNLELVSLSNGECLGPSYSFYTVYLFLVFMPVAVLLGLMLFFVIPFRVNIWLKKLPADARDIKIRRVWNYFRKL